MKRAAFIISSFLVALLWGAGAKAGEAVNKNSEILSVRVNVFTGCVVLYKESKGREYLTYWNCSTPKGQGMLQTMILSKLIRRKVDIYLGSTGHGTSGGDPLIAVEAVE